MIGGGYLKVLSDGGSLGAGGGTNTAGMANMVAAANELLVRAGGH